jgi:hypothetical protein
MFSTDATRIENPRLYPSEVVDGLRAALSSGEKLRANETRINFYDLATENRTYFIYVSPMNGDVTLIATWTQKRPSSGSESDDKCSLWQRITAHFLAA